MRVSHSSDNINNHKEESLTETLPLQQRLNEINTLTRRPIRTPSVTKTEKERTPVVLIRDIDRAASLPIEKGSYLFDYSLSEKGRGYSMQRDKVILFL